MATNFLVSSRRVYKANADIIIDRNGRGDLWVGDAESARDHKFLVLNNIRVIVNCTPEPGPYSSGIPNYYDGSIIYYRIPVNDSLAPEDIKGMTVALPRVVEFLEKYNHTMGLNVLIHCHKGIQRSATVATAYLCMLADRKLSNVKFDDVIHKMVKSRGVVFRGGRQINFIDSLIKYIQEYTPDMI